VRVRGEESRDKWERQVKLFCWAGEGEGGAEERFRFDLGLAEHGF
jgi:hypothetical protein